MKIYDSVLKEKVELIPIKPNEVRVYICGPTVYDEAHLGHARSALSFDLLARFLETQGMKVIMAKNFTDIDDKLIQKSLQTHTPINNLASHYIVSYLNDMEAINVRRATFEPKATEFLESMCTFIQDLLYKEIAYRLPNGDICLEVAKDSKYGSLSKHFNDKDSIHRIEIEEGKKDSRDFVLWKAYKGKDDVGYDSILGKGRPGWHIECSAMIDSVLAYKGEEYDECKYCIDIHAGGADLFFPHHENEASQTRTYTGKEIAKYWMHNGFVNINGEKMSKSLGNSFFMKDALKVYHGEILRNYLLGTHYRAPLNFNEEDLLVSKKRLDKIYRLKKRINYSAIHHFIQTHAGSKSKEEEWLYIKNALESLQKESHQDFIKDFFISLHDDLNISLALSVVEEFVKETNEYLDSNPKDKIYKSKVRATLEIIDFTLGLGMLSYTEYFQLGVNEEERQYIESHITKRLEAKQNKDFTLADSLRQELEQHGIILMDKPGGITEWEKA
ncbi:cysteine--tRNA ligase [Helicobacter didelphidarum]|uniref:Cysteine--tRNA ligase n=1 Tax=Helicobacter didelphidarum TaxID=2040648 RepID=A0A3D8IGJ0_9HELI|nr:cysteine--tRNA ligase [Helicobacter didelphidarum]RDU64220.1 cysteine--tRNA ligase [Helicobacter didelphidarum]